eukprot:Selendium_serpulae@DN5295_c0_g1_i2.p1
MMTHEQLSDSFPSDAAGGQCGGEIPNHQNPKIRLPVPQSSATGPPVKHYPLPCDRPPSRPQSHRPGALPVSPPPSEANQWPNCRSETEQPVSAFSDCQTHADAADVGEAHKDVPRSRHRQTTADAARRPQPGSTFLRPWPSFAPSSFPRPPGPYRLPFVAHQRAVSGSRPSPVNAHPGA